MSDVRNNSTSNYVAVAFVNLIYVILTVIMTYPGMFQEVNSAGFTSGYGITVAIYAIGIIYGFFCDLLLPSNNVIENRKKVFAVFSLLKGIFSAIICFSVVAYYFLASAEWLIWVSYGCTLVPAILVIVEAALLWLDHVQTL